MESSRLAALPFFADLPDAELAAVAGVAFEIELATGQTLATEGDLGHALFAIETGTADVVIGGEPVRTIGIGDLVGEMAVLASPPDPFAAPEVAEGGQHPLRRGDLADAAHRAVQARRLDARRASAGRRSARSSEARRASRTRRPARVGPAACTGRAPRHAGPGSARGLGGCHDEDRDAEAGEHRAGGCGRARLAVAEPNGA